MPRRSVNNLDKEFQTEPISRNNFVSKKQKPPSDYTWARYEALAGQEGSGLCKAL